MRTEYFTRHQGSFSVEDKSFPSNPTTRHLKISDWANSRALVIDTENNRTYLQASASHEYGDGAPCGICEERMLFLRNYRHSRGPMHFVSFHNRSAYYVEYEGIPLDLNKEELTRFLCVEVVGD